MENGDFNWIIPGKFLAFSGPHPKSKLENGTVYVLMLCYDLIFPASKTITENEQKIIEGYRSVLIFRNNHPVSISYTIIELNSKSFGILLCQKNLNSSDSQWLSSCDKVPERLRSLAVLLEPNT